MNISVILPIYAPTPFLQAMTEFCLKALHCNAKQPDKLEVVVVEVGQPNFEPLRTHLNANMHIDSYVNFPERTGHITKEFNAGVDKATGDLIVHAGNDVIVPPGWDDLLREPFEKYSDCGISSLAAREAGAIIGPDQPLPMIVEGWYSPFMCWRNGWKFDEEYLGCFCDSDIIMRHYAAGFRAYRNLKAFVWHMNNITHSLASSREMVNREIAQGKELFYRRWGDSPLWAFGMFRSGGILWGREHEAWTRPN